LVALRSPLRGEDADAGAVRMAAANATASTRIFIVSSYVSRVSTRGL
jgi:hypothetical protein